MTDTTPATQVIQQLAQQYGLGDQYYDFRGELRVSSDAARTAILRAMGVELEQSAVVDNKTIPSLLPAVLVCVQGELHCDLLLSNASARQVLHVRINTEAGQQLEINFHVAELQPLDNGRVRVRLPDDLPLGYHQLNLKLGKQQASCPLIVAPQHCYEAPVIAAGQKLWGLSIQLYTLRSPNNWGIGDFADLNALITAAAPQGCGLIGLNPLHALRPADARHISPYSPSSRDFLNVLYIAVTQVPEYMQCAEAQSWVAEHQSQLAALRDTAYVEYAAVAPCKFTVLSLLYVEFCRTQLARNTPRAQQFRKYINEQGDSLRLHALYDALDQHFSQQPHTNWGWRSWPEAFHDPHSAEVSKFATQYARQVEYFMYLQWLAATQLRAAQEAALAAGMQLGLYGDVAVGVDANGSEVWSHRKLYVEGMSVGAPPDPLALKGQDWGIPPQHPLQLQKQAYAPFTRMLRANMQAAGALRIDHVMSLVRLWWVPRGFSATEGVYVHYPLEDLIKLVALESVRNRCVVIGEDLGVVSDVMREAMQRFNVYRYKVLFFEKLRDGQYIAPDNYPRHALAAVTTHDLPLLKSWWNSLDIQLSESLHHYPDEATQHQVQREREIDRRQLMQAIVRAGLWHWQPYEPLPEYSHALMRAAYLYGALSNAALLVVQPDDLLYMTTPVNVPGTCNEYRNWQRKLSDNLETLLRDTDVQEVLRALNKARRGENPNN